MYVLLQILMLRITKKGHRRTEMSRGWQGGLDARTGRPTGSHNGVGKRKYENAEVSNCV